MHGLTPYSKLKKSKSAINPHVLKFPVVLMEDLLKAAGIITMFLKSHLTGKYVHTKCHFSHFHDTSSALGEIKK
jgi:hypothetical protein